MFECAEGGIVAHLQKVTFAFVTAVTCRCETSAGVLPRSVTHLQADIPAADRLSCKVLPGSTHGCTILHSAEKADGGSITKKCACM